MLQIVRRQNLSIWFCDQNLSTEGLELRKLRYLFERRLKHYWGPRAVKMVDNAGWFKVAYHLVQDKRETLKSRSNIRWINHQDGWHIDARCIHRLVGDCLHAWFFRGYIRRDFFREKLSSYRCSTWLPNFLISTISSTASPLDMLGHMHYITCFRMKRSRKQPQQNWPMDRCHQRHPYQYYIIISYLSY